MKRCALLTCGDLQDHILDEDALERALTDKQWRFQWVNWRDNDIQWDDFDCAIVRTTWDYTDDLPSFLSQMKKIAESPCRLFNSLSIITWNSEKTYLQQLSSQGVPIIPTLWLRAKTPEQLQQACLEMAVEDIIIKPQVGAGSKNTFRINTQTQDRYDDLCQQLLNKEIMIQPFLKNIVDEGEYSAHFFNNQFSHCVLKTPKANDFRSQEEFGSHVRSVSLSQQQMNFCENTLEKLPEKCLYARVDFINDGQGQPCLNELELVEPSLYFRYAQAAAQKMVQALEMLL